MFLYFDKYVIRPDTGYLLDDLYVSTTLGIEIDFYLKYKNQYPCKDKKEFTDHIENMKSLEKNIFNDSLNLFEKDLVNSGYFICAKLNTELMKDMVNSGREAEVTIQKY